MYPLPSHSISPAFLCHACSGRVPAGCGQQQTASASPGLMAPPCQLLDSCWLVAQHWVQLQEVAAVEGQEGAGGMVVSPAPHP
jgi:hypothetical protein